MSMMLTRMFSKSMKSCNDKLKQYVMEAEQEGKQFTKSLADDPLLQQHLEKLKFFDDNKGFKAETIARTETANAYNFGKYTNAEAFDQANPTLRVTKTWTPTQDNRTREAHRPGAIENVQGEKKRTVLREEPFVVDGERMMRPLDPAGSAGNVIRCRCVMTFDVKGE